MDEALERKIGLKLDGRLLPDEVAAVDAEIAADPRARAVERQLLALREALRADPGLQMPPALNRRIHERLAVERERQALRLTLLAPVRRFAVAAALVFTAALAAVAMGVGGSPFGRAHVEAAAQRTIEDDLRAPAAGADASLLPFLHRWFLGSDRPGR